MYMCTEEEGVNKFAGFLDGHVITMMNYVLNRSTYTLKNITYYSFFSIEEMPSLLDLPDEMILGIFNEVKPEVFLLSSMINIGNNRLEQLALTKCHSIDLTFDYYHPLDGSPLQRFYLFTLPHISNNIRSLSINLRHLIHLDTSVRNCIDEMIFSLTHLKIIFGLYHRRSGKCFTIGKFFVHQKLLKHPTSFSFAKYVK